MGHWAVCSALSREELIPNSRDEAVLHLRNEDKLFVFINAHEQRIEHVRPGDVTANDKLLLSVNAVLDPCA